MAQRDVSLHVRSSSSEYATNWHSLLVAAIVASAAVGLFAFSFFSEEPDKTARATDLSTTASPAMDVHSADWASDRGVCKRNEIRASHSQEDEAAPVYEPSDYYAWYGSAARLVGQVASTGASAAATDLHVRAALLRWPIVAALRSDVVAAMHERSVERVQCHELQARSEDELREYLLNQVPEISLDSVRGTSQALFDAGKSNTFASPTSDLHLTMLQKISDERSDMIGLPLLMGDACKTAEEVAKMRQPLATVLRQLTDERSVARLMEMREIARTKNGQFASTEEYFVALMGDKVEWKKPQQVSIVEQVLQSGSLENRRLLIHMLKQIEGREASEALARRAMFDLDETVRSAALAALDERDWAEYSVVFAHAKSFPLASTASAAAAASQACTAAAAPGQPSPSKFHVPMSLSNLTCVSRPFAEPGGTWVVKELVKVNHLRNCTLCHPASTSTNDPLRGPIPQPGQALPRVYYGNSRGNFVRADVVYIRQDFSVLLPVENAQPWPTMQRYDFFVRTRPASGVELADEMVRRSRAEALLEQLNTAIREEIERWQDCLMQRQQRPAL